MMISVVSTLYNSERFIEEFIKRFENIFTKINFNYEIILVNDGSPDNGVNIVKGLIKQNDKIKLISFSKNFGHHTAMLCGLENCCGDYIFLIDCDLEENPELFNEFYQEILNSKYDLIYGIQQLRNKDKFLGKLFWNILKRITHVSLANNPCTVRIMTRKFVDRLVLLPQKEFFLGELSDYIGLKQKTISINKLYKGNSSYNLAKKINMFINLIFTNADAFWIKLSLIAILISLISFLFFFFLLVSFFIGKNYLEGWLSIMVSISLVSSINFFFIAIVLQFVSKILKETRNKPRYIIDEKIGLN